jgi:hypothetical protein
LATALLNIGPQYVENPLDSLAKMCYDSARALGERGAGVAKEEITQTVDKLIAPKQIVAKLGGMVSYRTVINMIWAGKFGDVVHVSDRKIAVREAAVDAYITTHTVNPMDGQVVQNG